MYHFAVSMEKYVDVLYVYYIECVTNYTITYMYIIVFQGITISQNFSFVLRVFESKICML